MRALAKKNKICKPALPAKVLNLTGSRLEPRLNFFRQSDERGNEFSVAGNFCPQLFECEKHGRE